METKNYIIMATSLLQIILLLYVMGNYTKKILPHIKEEYRLSAKLALFFNTGLRKKWVDEEGWELMKKQGWIVFIGFLSIPFVGILILFVW